MAEIENSLRKKTGGKRMSKKNLRVDLTPMVDLGFLLITFFVLTTTMAEAKVMPINTPKDNTIETSDICESCVLTVLLSANDEILYYEGMPAINKGLQETTFAYNGIRKIIMQKKSAVMLSKKGKDDFVIIIKPTAESTMQNFIDIMDEITINNVKHYFIADMEKADSLLLAEHSH